MLEEYSAYFSVKKFMNYFPSLLPSSLPSRFFVAFFVEKQKGNYIHDIQDGGITIMESFNADIYDNIVKDVDFGVRITLGGGRNFVHDNLLDNCATGEQDSIFAKFP